MECGIALDAEWTQFLTEGVMPVFAWRCRLYSSSSPWLATPLDRTIQCGLCGRSQEVNLFGRWRCCDLPVNDSGALRPMSRSIKHAFAPFLAANVDYDTANAVRP